MISMKDIAATCGVSIATVSKALNGHKDIGEDTRIYIRKTAKELGYYPNSSARTLKTNRSYNIGVLFVDEANSGLMHDHFAHVLDSIKVAVESKGYDLTFLNCYKERENRISYLEHTKYRGLDGVIIACVDFADPEIVELVESNVPVVTIDYLFNNTTAIMSNNAKGIKELLTYVYSQGHRKIAYIHGADSAVTKSRLSSFYRTVEELGISIPDEYVREAAYRDTEETERQTKYLLDLPTPPTCILFPDDFAAFGGIKAITSRGLKIPDDVSIAGYDGIVIGKHIEPPLTTLDQDARELGKRAAEELIKLVEKPKTTLIEHIIVEGKLFCGKSVKKI